MRWHWFEGYQYYIFHLIYASITYSLYGRYFLRTKSRYDNDSQKKKLNIFLHKVRAIVCAIIRNREFSDFPVILPVLEILELIQYGMSRHKGRRRSRVWFIVMVFACVQRVIHNSAACVSPRTRDSVEKRAWVMRFSCVHKDRKPRAEKQQKAFWLKMTAVR